MWLPSAAFRPLHGPQAKRTSMLPESRAPARPRDAHAPRLQSAHVHYQSAPRGLAIGRIVELDRIVVVGKNPSMPRIGLHYVGKSVASLFAAGRMDLTEVRLVARHQFRLIGADKKYIPGPGRMNADAAKDRLQGLVQRAGKEIPARTEIHEAVDDQRSPRIQQFSHSTEGRPRHQ